MDTIITGVFTQRSEAEGAMKDLMEAGVSNEDISYVYLNDEEDIETKNAGDDMGEKAGEGAASGAATGGLIGAIAGLVVANGVLPGLGSVFVAGPLATALGLTGAAATTVSGALAGAVAGGLIGALTGLGIAREDAETYEERVRSGDILVVTGVTGEEEVNSVKDIYKNHQADEVRSYNP